MRSRLLRGTAFTLAAALAASPGSAQVPATDLSVTMKVSSDSGSGPTDASVRYRFSGPRTRLDISIPAMGDRNIYVVIDDRDSSMTTVMPGEQMAMVVSASAARAARPSIKTEILDGKVQVDSLGPGETILGHATQRYRVTQSGTLRISFGERSCTRPMAAVSEAWIAPGLAASMAAFQSRMASTVGTAEAGGDWMELLLTGTEGLPQGMTVRAISKSEAMVAGKNVTVTTTIELTELSNAPIEPATFTVPASFNTMDMRAMMAAMPPGALDAAIQSVQSSLPDLCGGG